MPKARNKNRLETGGRQSIVARLATTGSEQGAMPRLLPGISDIVPLQVAGSLDTH